MSNWFDPATTPIEMPKDQTDKPLTKAQVEANGKKLRDEIDNLIKGDQNDE